MSKEMTSKDAMCAITILITSPIYSLFAAWFVWVLWGWFLSAYISQPKLVVVWGLMTLASYTKVFLFEKVSGIEIDYGHVLKQRLVAFPAASMMALGILFIAQKVM